jgi:hypothetical protein
LNGFYYFCINQRKQEITTDTDIKTIKVVLGGAGLNEANDKLVLDTVAISIYIGNNNRSGDGL